jgi:Phage minor capsid protein 2.
VNCRHRRFPFIEGFSERTYTDEQLKNIDKPPITFRGKKYTAYEATQRQRQLETALRRVKRRLVAFKAAGDNEAYTADAARYRALNEEYEAFSKEAGLRSQLFERATIPEFGPKEAREALKVNK